MADALAYVSSLVDGGAAGDDSADAGATCVPAAPLAPIYAALLARGPDAGADVAPAPPGERSASSLLIRHVERTRAGERMEQERVIGICADTLATSAGDMDAASVRLAELLGWEQLDLVSALLADPRATGAQLQRWVAQRQQGVGSADEAPVLAAAYDGERYPNVYANEEHGNVLSAFGTRFTLPAGTTRAHESYYEEVTIPPSKPLPFRTTERLVRTDEMDALCQGAFHRYESLNRLQSAVYPMAYGTNENLLVCAPTGAGKTDVAMLAVLRCLAQHADGLRVRKHEFKIVYVAPMKALVAEIVAKFSQRLRYLGIAVRELTGDMQLTRREIAETQMIVTTPEKWDVVTRKTAVDSELVALVRLLIIDEVHLLHEDRGAVIETIVARTQRLVESTQTVIRVVGLSATLPNYVDVADFLGVNRWRGLFYFGASFRPVPLEQHFIGVRGKHGSALARGHLDRVAYENVLALVEDGHPVMVFVHTRKDTVRTAQTLLELGKEDGLSALLTDGREPSRFERDVASSRNKELRELYEHGIGIHHAGMLRSDRDLSERLFTSGATRVLCCTATLAWGVNLPAYAVIIKGTDVYNADAGRFVDLGILDVLQVFGRAGRPQYEDRGVGYICTSGDKLAHYVEAITAAHPIESTFLRGLVDALNAEVSLGTVASVDDGVSWLGFTYLYTRMKKAPLVYGIEHAELAADPALVARRRHWIVGAARVLAENGMCVFDEPAAQLFATNAGRIASRFYVSYRTVAVFRERLRHGLREADALDVMSRATDFAQVALRESEEAELAALLDRIPCQVPGGTKTAPGKVNILLQAHIANLYINDFALVSDARYVAQNAGRVLLALFELALDRGLGAAAFAFLSLAKAVDRRVWPFEHPLRQYATLSADLLHRIASYADELEVVHVRALPLPALAALLRVNERLAGVVHDAAEAFPTLDTRVVVRPRCGDQVELHVSLRPAFRWDERLHGGALPIVLWVEDAEQHVLHAEHLTLRAADGDVSTGRCIAVPWADATARTPAAVGYTVVWASSHWLGADGLLYVPFDDIRCPPAAPTTALCELPLLPLRTSVAEPLAAAYAAARVDAWNAVQTQVFHTLAHSRASALLCAPVASGKRTVAEMAIWRAVRAGGTVVVLEPCAAAAAACAARLAQVAPLVAECDVRVLREAGGRGTAAAVLVAAPEDVAACAGDPAAAPADAAARLATATLLVAHDLHALDARYELALMQVRRCVPTAARVVATSASAATATDLGAWLRVGAEHVTNLRPSDQPYPVALSFQGVDIPYSDALVCALVKPACDRLHAQGPGATAVFFVPSQAQCAAAGRELLKRLAAGGALPTDLRAVEPLVARVRNAELGGFLRQGVALWHGALPPSDRAVVSQLLDMGVVRVLVSVREACEALPFRAPLVAVLGTQYVPRYARPRAQVTTYGTAELLRMQAVAARPGAAGECLVLCQQTQLASVQRQLREPVALESSIAEPAARAVLVDALVAEVRAARVRTLRDAVAWLGTSFMARRMRANPAYYDIAAGLTPVRDSDVDAALSRLVDAAVSAAERLGALTAERGGSLGDAGASGLRATRLGTSAPPGAIARLASVAEYATRGGHPPECVARVLARFEDRIAASLADPGAVRDALWQAAPKPLHFWGGTSARESSLSLLLVAQWLAPTEDGAQRRAMEASVGAVGAQAAAVLAEERDALLLQVAESWA
ncbi:RNA helicase [Malassezia sp. CBS 17886]|nr:RNA helicase [Malassezia sp. CBS 17886]